MTRYCFPAPRFARSGGSSRPSLSGRRSLYFWVIARRIAFSLNPVMAAMSLTL